MSQNNLSDPQAGALPTVSIIIPCYNGERYVGQAIESCLALHYPAIEIIVIDDGSSDLSLEMIRSYEKVICISQPNRGQAAARNAGLAASSGKFLVFLDHDDEMVPDALCTSVALLQSRSDLSFVYGYPLTIGADGRVLNDPPESVRREEYLTYTDALYVRLPIPPSLALFRGDLIRRLGGFNTAKRYSEDLDFFLRVLNEAPGWRHRATTVRYRKHGSNMSGQKARCLKTTIGILEEQGPIVQGNPLLEAEWRNGMRSSARHYGAVIPSEIVKSLRSGEIGRALEATWIFLAYAPHTIQGATARFFPETLRPAASHAPAIGEISAPLG